jgi:hypothetical protein
MKSPCYVARRADRDCRGRIGWCSRCCPDGCPRPADCIGSSPPTRCYCGTPHPHQRLLAQPGRTLVRRAHQPQTPPLRPPQRHRTGSRHTRRQTHGSRSCTDLSSATRDFSDHWFGLSSGCRWRLDRATRLRLIRCARRLRPPAGVHTRPAERRRMGGLGRLGQPSVPRPSRVSVSYSAGQQPFEPVPPQLSYTRSGGTRGTASWDHLCVITGAGGPRRWGGSRRSTEFRHHY